MSLEDLKKVVAEKGVETALTTSIKSLIETAVTKIDSGIQSYNAKIKFEKAIKKYMINGYEDYLYMNTIVFGNAKKTLFELYQPLTIAKAEFAQSQNEEEYMIDEGIEFVVRYQNILIEDTAGMGKSTIVKYLAIICLVSDQILPFVIELRNLKDNSIIAYIRQHIQSLSEELEEKNVAHFLEKGKFVFLFDGYDEIEEKYKPLVADQIIKFMAKLPNSYFVITSRKEDGLNSFGSFQKFTINDLNEEEAYELIERYDNHGKISEALIGKLKTDKNFKNTKDLLKNPLLVSLLYKTFEYGSEIPYKKTDFYALIFDALFDKHDKTKGNEFQHEKKSGLDSTEFNHLLRMVAYLSLKEDTIEYSKDKLKIIIGKCLQNMKWLSCSVDSFYYDITHAVPFFQEYNHKVKWVHKSFQEYFAANYIYLDKENKADILTYMARHSSKYYNILDFYYDLDIRNFRKIIIGPLLKVFITQCDVEYTDEFYKDLSKDEKGERTYAALLKEITFLKDDAIFLDYEEGKSNEDEIIEKWKKNWGKDVSAAMFFWEEKVFILNRIEKEGTIFNISILNLLYDKKVNIFLQRKIEKPVSIDLKDGLYELNDDINNPINIKDNFTKINCFIWKFIGLYCDNINMGAISYKKAVELYDNIERESKCDDDIFDL